MRGIVVANQRVVFWNVCLFLDGGYFHKAARHRKQLVIHDNRPFWRRATILRVFRLDLVEALFFSELAFILFFAKTLATRHVLAWNSARRLHSAKSEVRYTITSRYSERQLFSLRIIRACKYIPNLREIPRHAETHTMNTVGERIKARRLERGWTQEQLAEKAGISKGFLSDLETGTRNVSAEYLLKIAQALNVTLDFLMKGDSSKPEKTRGSDTSKTVRHCETEKPDFRTNTNVARYAPTDQSTSKQHSKRRP